jgi:hypothetical protein
MASAIPYPAYGILFHTRANTSQPPTHSGRYPRRFSFSRAAAFRFFPARFFHPRETDVGLFLFFFLPVLYHVQLFHPRETDVDPFLSFFFRKIQQIGTKPPILIGGLKLNRCNFNF